MSERGERIGFAPRLPPPPSSRLLRETEDHDGQTDGNDPDEEKRGVPGWQRPLSELVGLNGEFWLISFGRRGTDEAYLGLVRSGFVGMTRAFGGHDPGVYGRPSCGLSLL